MLLGYPKNKGNFLTPDRFYDWCKIVRQSQVPLRNRQCYCSFLAHNVPKYDLNLRSQNPFEKLTALFSSKCGQFSIFFSLRFYLTLGLQLPLFEYHLNGNIAYYLLLLQLGNNQLMGWFVCGKQLNDLTPFLVYHLHG